MFKIPFQFTHYLMIFKWSEFLEVIAFSCAFYFFAKWLKQDTSKKLLPLFFGYSFLFIVADAAQLVTLSTFLFSFAPVFLLLFIIAHQKILQRNFVTMQSITPATLENTAWTHEIVKALLTTFAHSKDIICVVECDESLQTYLEEGIELNSFIHKELLTTIFNSLNFDATKIVYITKNGIIKKFNCVIKHEFEQVAELTEYQKLLRLSKQLDCGIIKTASTSRTFDISLQGKVLENINAQQLLTILQQYLKKNKFIKDNNESIKKDSGLKQHNA